MVSEKYIAGFLDADGCISISWKKGIYKPLLDMKFSQKTSKDKVIKLISESVDGGIIVKQEINGESYSTFALRGKFAEMLLNRIKKHLVIKKRYAQVCLDIIETRSPYPDWKEKAKWLKEQRKIMSLPLANYPSRKWMAGYLDGDGCFHARTPGGKCKSTRIDLSVGTINYDREGIDLMHKVFGGCVTSHGTNGTGIRWILCLSPTKAKQLYDYCGNYFITKKDQFDFIFGCAKMGNYRDGKTIKEALKQLKARDHRLNEPSVEISKLLNGVEKYDKFNSFDRKQRMRKSEQAIAC
jgi:hypothetical protein